MCGNGDVCIVAAVSLQQICIVLQATYSMVAMSQWQLSLWVLPNAYWQSYKDLKGHPAEARSFEHVSSLPQQ